jgi:hypothetical protein
MLLVLPTSKNIPTFFEYGWKWIKIIETIHASHMKQSNIERMISTWKRMIYLNSSLLNLYIRTDCSLLTSDFSFYYINPYCYTLEWFTKQVYIETKIPSFDSNNYDGRLEIM